MRWISEPRDQNKMAAARSSCCPRIWAEKLSIDRLTTYAVSCADQHLS